MAHDVFISYSSKDKSTADAACHALEQNGIRCWIAPRDETAGISYFIQITDAIHACQLVVLLFSAQSNISDDVIREVHIALENAKAVIPFRIEDVLPGNELSYLLSGVHWLDAHPDQADFADLADHVQRHLGMQQTPHVAPASPHSTVSQAQETVPQPQEYLPPIPRQDPNQAASPTPSSDPEIKAGESYIGKIFSGKILSNLNAKACDFTRCVFRECDLRSARLEKTILSEANLEKAQLDGASLRGARIDFANLQEASCVGVDFEYARLTRSDLRRADLTQANFLLLAGQKVSFEDAIAINANFADSLLNDADFRSADLRGADFTNAVIDGASFIDADLTGARGLTIEQLRSAIIDQTTRLDPSWREQLSRA